MAGTDDAIPSILSTRCFSRAESIDGGDTIVLHFRAADGKDAAVLIPRKAAQAASQALTAQLSGGRPDTAPDD